MPNTTFDDTEPRCRCGHVAWYHYALIEGTKQTAGNGACCKMDCSCMQWTDVPKPKSKKKVQSPQSPPPVPA